MKHQVSTAGSGSAGAPYSWEGVERVYAPVFTDESWDPVSMAIRHKEYIKEGPEVCGQLNIGPNVASSNKIQGMTNAYRTIASEGAKSYGMIVRQLLSNPPPGNGFIIHCTAGKDRTGVLAALLLQLAGVPDEAIVEEYGLTNIGLGKWLDFLVELVQKQTGESAEASRRMASARPDSMAGFLAWLRTQGGAEAYFKDKCALTEDDVKKLREIFIVDEPPTAALKN
jgi:hypothetical protein